MVYGIVSLPLHKGLTLPQVGVSYVGLCVLLFALVRLKNRVMRDWQGGRAKIGQTAIMG